MRWNDPQRLERLAGEYVLGTLRGPARRRLERELQANRMLRSYVEEWEQRLVPLALALDPVAPPGRVWNSLKNELEPRPLREGLWHHLGFWRWVGILASSVALLLLVYFGSHQKLFVQPGPAYVAVVSDEKAQPAWLLSLPADFKTLEVKTVASLNLPGDKSLELWMLPGDGKPPVSLGLLPIQGSKTFPLREEQVAILKSAKGLAVSLEPAGGSPTGAPTGPVQYQGAIFSLI
jgi:Uncharacterized protein conserved in bacteria